MEQKNLSKWLKCIIAGVGICGLLVYVFVFPFYGEMLREGYPEFANRFWPWMIFLWISGIPCFTVLVFAWKVATNIGLDKSFSEENAKLFKWTSVLAASDSVFFFVGNMIMLILNMSHPGVVIASLVVVFIGVSVTVASAALSYLVKKASVLQEQSDLTI